MKAMLMIPRIRIILQKVLNEAYVFCVSARTSQARKVSNGMNRNTEK